MSQKYFYQLSKRQRRNIRNKIDFPTVLDHPADEPIHPTPAPESQTIESREYDLMDVEESDVLTVAVGKNTKEGEQPELYGEIRDNTEDNSDTLTEDLCFWVIKHSISHSHVTDLLKLLRKHFPTSSLPSDSRTLLRTPRTINSIVEVPPGHYKHFGISSGIKQNIIQCFSQENIPDYISLNVNMDGLPLSKSSGSQFWPILGSMSTDDISNVEPFIIGMYHGYHKPEDSNEYLKYFVEDMKTVEQNGIEVFGKKVEVKLKAIICDSPARAYVTSVKGHNAYFGCGKCITEGEYIEGRVTYPEIEATLRTDESFRNKLQEEHHKQETVSILTNLNIDMVENIPLDYMHLCCLGVMKRVLQLLCKGPKNVKMNKDQWLNFSTHFIQLGPFIPHEFTRRPRNLLELDRFKATEFRQILLYTGMVTLKECLSAYQYTHFMSICLAIRILVSKDLHLTFNDYAQSLLQYFVKNFSRFYGSCNVSYNVHNLIHLSSDVINLGPLDTFSSFKFENFMQKIGKKINKISNKDPLKQLCNRLHEEMNVIVEVQRSDPIGNYPLIIYNQRSTARIKCLQFKDYYLSCKRPDNTCILKNKNIVDLISIRMVKGEISIESKVYSSIESLFLHPCDSKNFDIGVIDEEVYETLHMSLDELKLNINQKCVRMPSQGNKFVVVPLIHSE